MASGGSGQSGGVYMRSMGKGRGCGADIAGTNLFSHRDLYHRGLGGRGFDGPLDREVLLVIMLVRV